MAVDRGNARVSDRFDPLNRPFLRLLRQVVEAADRTRTPLTLCGELAGRSLSAMALIGLGFRSISMSPTAIGPVKSMLLSLDVKDLEGELLAALSETETENSKPIRKLLAQYAEVNNVSL